MPWSSSDRRQRLPSNWNSLAAEVKKRDGGKCRAKLPSGARCPRPGTDVDHIVNDDNHDLSNLQLLCPEHHKRKTAREAFAGKKKPKRPPEGHPGML